MQQQGEMAVSTQTHKALYVHTGTTYTQHKPRLKHTLTHRSHLSADGQTYKRYPSRDPQMYIIHAGLFGPLYDNETDLRVKKYSRIKSTHIQEPGFVFFHCLSYPNADQLRRAMPEGHWSLSTLPGNGLLVRMGLEGSL